jgi:hypothetical protein
MYWFLFYQSLVPCVEKQRDIEMKFEASTETIHTVQSYYSFSHVNVQLLSIVSNTPLSGADIVNDSGKCISTKSMLLKLGILLLASVT